MGDITGLLTPTGGSGGAVASVAGRTGVVVLTTADIGGLAVSSVASSPAASVNDYSPAGYTGGTTNRLVLAAAAGGSTITGLSATGVPDGFTLIWENSSTTDSLTFPHLSASSLAANRFSNVNAASVQIAPLGAARCTYIVNKWQFA